jgi:DNA-binding NarL/FixJ family response regulator
MTEIIPFNNDFSDRPSGSVTDVLIVSSQELIRDVLRTTLSSVDEAHAIGETDHGDNAMRAVEELRPDVVVIESRIGPDAEGVRSGYRFKSARPSLGIVVLADGFSPDVMQYLSAKTGSGWSFISRAAALEPERLWRAIDSAARGQGAIDPGLERSAVETSTPLLERLTVEQARALELIAAGVSDAGVAARLDLTRAETLSLIETLYKDMHIDEGPRIDRRVVATLVYLRETVRLQS